MVQSGQDSLLPLFLINPSDKGGFEFDQTDIGWLYTGIGPVQIIFNHILSFSHDFFPSFHLLFSRYLLVYGLILAFIPSLEFSIPFFFSFILSSLISTHLQFQYGIFFNTM